MKHACFFQGVLILVFTSASAVFLACDQQASLGNTSDGPWKNTPDGSRIETDAPRRQIQSLPEAVDVLLVIDNSPSMKDNQENLVKGFPKLLSALIENLGGKHPDLHLGIITPDLGAGDYGISTCERPGGDKGKLIQKSLYRTCARPAQSWIELKAGKTNIIEAQSTDALQQIHEAFACLALITPPAESPLAHSGCSFEQPLEAARQALTANETNPAQDINHGTCDHDPKIACSCYPTCQNDTTCGGKTCRRFHRPEALLAVIFVTDEDDCSAKDVGLFNPDAELSSKNGRLGPVNSFRCFEFGITCDEDRGKDARAKRTPGSRTNCLPNQDNPPFYTHRYLYDVQEYVDFFKNKIKPWAPERVLGFAIAGPVPQTLQVASVTGEIVDTKPTCVRVQTTGEMEDAASAIRIQAVLKGLGDQGHFNKMWVSRQMKELQDGICTPNLVPSLEAIGQRIAMSLKQTK